ncbi:MAG: acyloxyacyl hydrolase [Saprospiraceae bacterium]|nr:acyloxyacyl hydrolase [Saprospiraceae bacterium]
MKGVILWIGFFVLFTGHQNLFGQHGVSFVYAPSKVIKHRSNLLFDVPDRTHEFRVAYTLQTSGNKRWERYWGKPRIVLNGLFVNYGDKDVLGNAVAILPELHFTLKQWNTLRLNLQFGTGIAHLNKPYNAISNPNNNAIGSYLNNITSLKFGLEYRWNAQWMTTLSTGLVHFSNGLSSSPNAGINIYGLSIGGIYNFDRKKDQHLEEDLLTQDRAGHPLTYKKWIFDIQYHYGFTEYTVPDGPKYGVRALSIGGGYRYTEFMTITAGAEYEFNNARYTFFKRNFYTEEEALDQARSTIVYAEHELRFGRVFNRFRLGFYLPYPIQNSRTLYTKVVTGLYLPEVRGHVRPYIGVVLKTHTAVADYLGILFGVSI